MYVPQETCISLCTNVSPNSAYVWAKGHKVILGKYHILYTKFQWLLCSPPAGGRRQLSVHTGFIAWILLAPGATFIWLYPRAEIERAGWNAHRVMLPWQVFCTACANREARGRRSSSPTAAPQPCLQESSATSLPGWVSLPSLLSFPPSLFGEKLTRTKRSALRDKPRHPFEKWVL